MLGKLNNGVADGNARIARRSTRGGRFRNGDINLCGRSAGRVVAVDDAALSRADAVAMVRDECRKFAALMAEVGLAVNIEAMVADLFEAECRRLRLAMGV